VTRRRLTLTPGRALSLIVTGLGLSGLAICGGWGCAETGTGGRWGTVSPGVRSMAEQRQALGLQPAEGAPARLGESARFTSEPWSFQGAPGMLIRTPRFALYTTESSEVIRGRLPSFLEAAVDHYVSAIVPLPQPTAPMTSYIMASRPQWQRLTLQHLGDRGRALMGIPRGGFAIGGRAYLFDIGAADTLAVAAHEGWHQYTQSTFAERLPLWAEEGLATFMEGHRWHGQAVTFAPWSNTERFDRLRDAVAREELLPLERLLNASTESLLSQGGDSATGYYAQVWALIHFLNEGAGGKYRPALQRMLLDAARGGLGTHVITETRRRVGPTSERSTALTLARTLGVQVFRSYFEEDLAVAEAEYRLFVQQVVATGARQAVVEGRSPFLPTGVIANVPTP
jgi:hypothetical protein